MKKQLSRPAWQKGMEEKAIKFSNQANPNLHENCLREIKADHRRKLSLMSATSKLSLLRERLSTYQEGFY